MPFISVTRLKLRSIRFLPAFAVHAIRSNRQVSRASGFHNGALLADRAWTFWTMTLWDTQASMRQYMTTGAHRIVMPHLLDWCDEASVVHWEQAGGALPSWSEADTRMRDSGRPSKVHNPSPGHANLSYRAPRLTRGGSIRPVAARARS